VKSGGAGLTVTISDSARVQKSSGRAGLQRVYLELIQVNERVRVNGKAERCSQPTKVGLAQTSNQKSQSRLNVIA
jgi:hypothetical protein